MDYMRMAKQLLEGNFWLPELETMVSYSRVQDDHDGTFEGEITVQITPDGDVWLMTDKSNQYVRFRMPGQGGGLSPRTRNALMLLAFAIQMDNRDSPQRHD